MKAERDLYQLRRELEKLESGEAPVHESLPDVRRGGKAVDVGNRRSRDRKD